MRKDKKINKKKEFERVMVEWSSIRKRESTSFKSAILYFIAKSI